MFYPDEGYYYGIGAFETIAVENGVPILFEEHKARPERAMNFLSISASMKNICEEAEKVLKSPGIKTGRKVLKIAVSEKNLIITFRENTYTAEDYKRGFVTAISQVRRNETSPFTYYKTMNYGDCLFEKRRQKANGADEPIFLNTKGEICEGATTNVFFVKNSEIFTPPVSCGILPGIMREYICSRYAVRECIIRPEEVSCFDEMFLTNSLLGVMPVISLNGFNFPSRKVGAKLQFPVE